MNTANITPNPATVTKPPLCASAPGPAALAETLTGDAVDVLVELFAEPEAFVVVEAVVEALPVALVVDVVPLAAALAVAVALVPAPPVPAIPVATMPAVEVFSPLLVAFVVC